MQAAWKPAAIVDPTAERAAKSHPPGDTPANASVGRWVLQRPIDEPLSLPLYNLSAYWPSWVVEGVPAAVWGLASTRGEMTVRVMVVVTSVTPLRVWLDEDVSAGEGVG